MRTHPLGLAAVLIVVVGCAKGTEKPAAAPPDTGAKVAAPSAPAPAPAAAPAAVAKGAAVKPSATSVAKLEAPKVPKKVVHRSSLGTGKLAVTLAETPGGGSIWVERIDIEGAGDVEPAELAVNSTTHVAYAYGQAAILCKDGTREHGPQIMAVYLDGNVFKQPTGSGWYATELKTGQCGMTEPTVWGSRFDALGKITAEGVAMVYPKTGDLLLVTAAEIAPKK